jgi:hypothetical protein
VRFAHRHGVMQMRYAYACLVSRIERQDETGQHVCCVVLAWIQGCAPAWIAFGFLALAYLEMETDSRSSFFLKWKWIRSSFLNENGFKVWARLPILGCLNARIGIELLSFSPWLP